MSDQAPVYLLAQLEITDMDAFFSDYALPLQPLNQKYGVEVLVGTPEVATLEGDYDKNFTVVLRFPSAEAQAQWYADPAYQPLLARRQALTRLENTTMIVAPAFRGPPA
ncbi:MAG: DUF1330 domain-containing protein [Kiloniellales bacterium]|nr:DUF1330 domain-containing protein [Kiloniellales bacterium]